MENVQTYQTCYSCGVRKYKPILPLWDFSAFMKSRIHNTSVQYARGLKLWLILFAFYDLVFKEGTFGCFQSFIIHNNHSIIIEQTIKGLFDLAVLT